jgi:hypothetical protein
VVLLPIAVSLLLPMVFFLIATFSCVAFIVNWGAWRIIRRYLTPDDLAGLEAKSSPLN